MGELRKLSGCLKNQTFLETNIFSLVYSLGFLEPTPEKRQASFIKQTGKVLATKLLRFALVRR